MLDAQRAVRYVRHHADRFGIDKNRLGMLGFSAGGHLTLATGTDEDPQELDASDPIDRESSRPDFMVPVYAVSNGIVRGRKASEYFETDTKVNESTPPTFLVHTHEDGIVPSRQSTLFYDALRRARVPAELHVFGYGEHGVGLASGDPDTSAWFGLLHGWLRRTGLLTKEKRVAIRQKLPIQDSIDADLGMIWVTFVPENPLAPVARTRLDPASDWVIDIPQSHGPVPGMHTLELRRISHVWPFDARGEYDESDFLAPVLAEEPTVQKSVLVQNDGSLEF